MYRSYQQFNEAIEDSLDLNRDLKYYFIGLFRSTQSSLLCDTVKEDFETMFNQLGLEIINSVCFFSSVQADYNGQLKLIINFCYQHKLFNLYISGSNKGAKVHVRYYKIVKDRKLFEPFTQISTLTQLFQYLKKSW